MKKLLKIEMERALWNQGMFLSLVFGFFIVFWHQWEYVWNPGISMKNIFCMESVIYRWIGASCFPMQSYLYYLLLPVLAVLPAGSSFFDDLRTGYHVQFYLREKKREYLWAKYISVFVSGGFAFTVPLVFSLLFTAMRFPMLPPEPVMNFGPDRTSILFGLYYHEPWIYIGIFLLLDFIFAGGFASVTLAAVFQTEYRAAVLLTPCILYYFLFSLDDLLGGHDFSPNYFLIPGFAVNYWWEYAIGIAAFLGIFVYYYWKAGKKEC